MKKYDYSGACLIEAGKLSLEFFQKKTVFFRETGTFLSESCHNNSEEVYIWQGLEYTN